MAFEGKICSVSWGEIWIYLAVSRQQSMPYRLINLLTMAFEGKICSVSWGKIWIYLAVSRQ
jgi:hypothetical protein